MNELVGQRVEIAQFGRFSYWTGDGPLTLSRQDAPELGGCHLPVDGEGQEGSHIGVEWENARQFSRVEARFAEAFSRICDVRLQYWAHNWPPDLDGGWTAVDDLFHGRWVTANGEAAIEGDTWSFVFDPLDITEIHRAQDFAVHYRQSLRVRLLFPDGLSPAVAELMVFSDSVWREAALRVEFGLCEQGVTYAGPVGVHNGCVLSADESDPRSVALRVLYADTRNYGEGLSIAYAPDRTVVTVSGVERDFSFLVTDALRAGVCIPDFGVFVGEAGRGGYEAWNESRPDDAPVPIYDRVLDEPEQDYLRASREIPQLIKTRQDKFGRYVPIGCDANRQEFAVRFNGDVFADKYELKLVGRDPAKLLWPGNSLWFKFPTGDPPDFREREDGTQQSARNGCLPIYTSVWRDREFIHEMTVFSALLHESPWEEDKKRGDEPMVALSRVGIRNTTDEKRRTRFWIVIEQPEKLSIDDQGFVYAEGRLRDDHVPDSASGKRWVVEGYSARRLRAQMRTNGVGKVSATPCCYQPHEVTSFANAVAYDIELEPRQSHEIELFIPFITFSGDEGRDAVASLDYDAKLAEMTAFWEAQIGAGARIQVPEELLTDFNKANVAHIAITADKDTDTGLYIVGAGTWRYQVFGTETVEQCRALDLRGYHDRARKYITPFVELQGTRRMDGRFKTQAGAFHGVRVNDSYDYQVGDYSVDHGTVLWWLCEHYKLTRDVEWLGSVAPNIIAACDYVTFERQATMETDASGQRVRQFGLLPPAHLDDNPEWQYWYVVNALAYRGMTVAGEVLAEIGHADASRIAADAKAYGDDIRRSLARSIELAPVVGLADGSYIPQTPVRCLLRGRDIGWIRESLFGAVFNMDCGLIEYDSAEATWILKDFEDNISVSRRVGRQVDLERFWFSQGGLTIQSNLLPNTLVYLARGQVEHALRAFYNSMAANLYADVRCFTEHPVAAYGLGVGPFYKTPDESAFITWLRYLLLMERGSDLILAPGTPRSWLGDGKEILAEEMPTYFGPVSLRIASRVNSGRIHAEIVPPKRNPPARLLLHIRHPEGVPMRGATVNGSPHASSGELVVVECPFPDKIEIVAEY
ncbi:MAG: hypothetical protein KBC96_03935 [Armatimonadetes bacterium]|nr:hypothetical protein [Armatimonadota bacterium]